MTVDALYIAVGGQKMFNAIGPLFLVNDAAYHADALANWSRWLASSSPRLKRSWNFCFRASQLAAMALNKDQSLFCSLQTV